MIYEVDSLPALIEIGVQSEKGVRDIPFHVKSWMDEFDGIKFEVMVTPAGAKAAHLAASTLVGDVLYWHVSDSDTIRGGEGKVEILGHLPDKRKLSGWAATKIRETSTLATAEPPEVERPYYEAILEAADRIENAVAQEAVQSDMNEANASEKSFVRNRTHYDVEAQDFPAGMEIPEGAVSVTLMQGETETSFRLVKMSDIAPPSTDLLCSPQCRVGDSSSQLLTAEHIRGETTGGYIVGLVVGSVSRIHQIRAAVCFTAGYAVEANINASTPVTATLPEPGLYMLAKTEGTTTVGRLSWDGYTRTLADKYIPDTVLRKDEIPEMPTDDHIRSLADAQLSLFGQAVCLPETTHDNGSNLVLDDPWAVEIRAGQDYIVIHNSKTYRLTARNIPDSAVGAVLLGNGTNADLPDHNPDLPFGVLAVSNAIGAQLGAYGTVYTYDNVRPFTFAIYEASGKGYYYYDGTEARLMSVKELRQALIDAGKAVTILAETTVQGEGGQMPLATELAAAPEVGVTYKVTYNGTAYDCPALGYAADGMAGVMLGNSDAMGVPGGNPDAPFVILLVPGGADIGDGLMLYGIIMDMVGAAEATLSIVEDVGGPEYMTREQVVELINEMTGGGATPADADVFYTADGQTFTTVDAAVLHVQKGEQ